MQTRFKVGIVKPRSILSLTVQSSKVEPTSYTHANKDSMWRHTMEDEFNALIENKTWYLVLYRTNMNVVTCKWIYKIKYRSDGTVECPKTHVVARGIHQVEYIDFHETFSPIIKPTNVRLILSLSVFRNWVIRQLDVKNTFLHGHLDDE